MNRSYEMTETWFRESVNIVEEPAEGNVWRWSMYHKFMVDVCIGLYWFRLPAYVILEIIDWLPEMQKRWTQYKKIQLIESLIGSLREITNKK